MSKYRYILTMGLLCSAVLCNDLTIQTAYALAQSTAHNGSNAKAVHALGETGDGVNVGLITARNALATHEAFYDKDVNGAPTGSTHLFNYDYSGSGISDSDHDTFVAGIVSSRGGISRPNYTGAAPGADVYCARVIDDYDSITFPWLNNALKALITQHNCRAIATGFSFGTILAPDGDSDWTLLYDYYAYNYNVIFANGAGNEDTQLAVFGDAYNGITTGGLRVTEADVYERVGSISGSGPTADYRSKPDITAPSQNQTVPTNTSDTSWFTWLSSYGHTSLSMPHTAGVAALLFGLADDTLNTDDNQNEVIKAVIINSAFPNIDDKSGASTNPADSNNVWHEDRGFGRIDALRAYELLDSNEISTGVTITQPKGWSYSPLPLLTYHSYTIQVSERCRLVATLAWDRRIQWTDNSPHNGTINEGELHPYLADLDMEIYEPNNATPIFDKLAFGYDPDDNTIKADLLLTNSGQYTIKVVNNSAGESTNYGLAFELLSFIPADFDFDYIVDYNDLAEIADNWLQLPPSLDIDLFSDGFIDFKDFAVFAEYWLNSIPAYYNE